MKKALLTAILLTIGASVNAQQAAVYQMFPAGLATIPAGATNTFLVGGQAYVGGWPGTLTNFAQTVSEYDDVGLTFSVTAPAGTTGTCTCNVYRSYDAGNGAGTNPTYEQNPGFVLSFTPNAAGTYTTNLNLHIPGVNSIAFVVTNGVTATLTSAELAVNLKLPKRGALQATQ